MVRRCVYLIFVMFAFFTTLVVAAPPRPEFTDDGVLYTQVGSDGFYVEVYTKDEQCPVVFQNVEGKRQPFYAEIGDDGYLSLRNDLPVKDMQPETAKEKVLCGFENIRKRRPQFPPPPHRKLNDQVSPYRLQHNAEQGIGFHVDSFGRKEYSDPRFKTLDLTPPRLPLPKPIIDITGAVTYEPEFKNQTFKVLVILVQFPDQKPSMSVEDIKEKFFGKKGFASYYKQQSYGVLALEGDVIQAWYTLPQNMGYYGDNYEANIEAMIDDAISAADKDVDFSQYDSDGDGVVDAFFVVHAGGADEDGGGNGEEIWSHYYTISPVTVDGVQVIDYETVSEESPVGIIAHEFGHYLGLPDLYDTVPDDGLSKGIGDWSIMGYGGYLEDAGSFDPWSKYYLGWLDSSRLISIENPDYYSIVDDQLTYGAPYYRLKLSSSEYFLVENRHKQELMDGGSGEGLLVWHVDQNVAEESGTWNGCSGTRFDCNAVEGNADHKFLDVEEASHEQSLDEGTLGDSDDPWFSDNQQLFSPNSEPSSTAYGSSSSHVVINVLSDPGATMQFAASLNGTLLQKAEKPLLATEKESNSSLVTFFVLLTGVIILGLIVYLGIVVYKRRHQ